MIFPLRHRPQLLLALCMALALAICIAGVIAARITKQVVPLEARVEALETAAQLAVEANRLDSLFAADLRELTVFMGATDLADTLRMITHKADQLHGPLACAVATRASPEPLQTQRTRDAGARPLPQIRLIAPETKVTGSQDDFILPQGLVFSASGDNAPEGWVANAAGTFGLFWTPVTPERTALILLDLSVVKNIYRARLQHQLESHRPSAASGQNFRSRLSEVALGDSNEISPPGSLSNLEAMMIPIATRVGIWQFTAIPRPNAVISYNIPLLVSGSVLALAVAGLGVIFFLEQKRALRRAEQQASFMNSVSHELCAPLTNLRLHTELAHEAMQTGSNEPAKLSPVLEEIGRLERLVSNVLTQARLAHRRYTPDWIVASPDDVVDAALKQFAPALQRRHINVQRNGSSTDADLCPAGALTQIVVNLISNVEKHAAEGKTLIVETERSCSEFKVRVSDKGPGVPAKDRTRVFEAFQTGSASLTAPGSGTGLGLAICRELATACGGSISIAPSTQGFCVEVSLPIRSPDTPPIQEGASP